MFITRNPALAGRCLLALTFCLFTSMAHAQTTAMQAAALPAGGEQMIAYDDATSMHINAKDGPNVGSTERFTVENMPFKNAVRLTSLKVQQNPWDVITHVQTQGVVVRPGDVFLLSFWMRSPWSEDETGDGVANIYIELNEKPYNKIAVARASSGKQWRQILIPFTAAPMVGHDQLQPGQTHVSLHLGHRPQTVELGGFQLVNYLNTRTINELPRQEMTYRGREMNAPWRGDAANRIEQYRKADLQINVTDASGKPVTDADIHVQMTRHAFKFGTAVTARLLGMELNQVATHGQHKSFPVTVEDVKKYRQIVEENYNWVVLENDFKMYPYLEGIKATQKDARGVLYRHDWLDNALAWLNERDIKVRGHRIFNGRMGRHVNWDPARREELRTNILAQAQQKVTDAGTRVTEWDCINHPLYGSGGDPLDKYIGEPDFYAKCIAMGHKLAPHAQMWVNEGSIVVGEGARVEGYENMIKTLIQYNQPPDGIGFMAHYNATTILPPDVIFQRMERFAPYAPRMQFTELDISTNDEQLQADYMRDMLTVAFSHPKFVGIIQWGFWAGKHWMPEAGLWDKDWREKPSAKAYRNLVFKQWWTDQTIKSSTNGSATVRGFKGDYTLTITRNGKIQQVKTTLSDDGQTVNVKLD